MNILRHLKVPTGDIVVVQGERGKLELLSLGDYGKQVNLNQDQEVVDGTPLLPLEEKWVITISTQIGCSMNCRVCDVPKVGPGINATARDMIGQFFVGRELHPEVRHTKRLNLHFARMGEPTFNLDVLEAAKWLRNTVTGWGWGFHPVVSTMMPRKHGKLQSFIDDWVEFKNVECDGEAGLQLSINSTDEAERHEMFSGNALSLSQIQHVMRCKRPLGRKWTLNFAVAGYTVEPGVLLKHFSPRDYICKLTPMHKTATATENGIATAGNYTQPEPYTELADQLRRAGYEVLVFIASHDEDAGRITCGNAILSGSLPHKYEEVSIGQAH